VHGAGTRIRRFSPSAARALRNTRTRLCAARQRSQRKRRAHARVRLRRLVYLETAVDLKGRRRRSIVSPALSKTHLFNPKAGLMSGSNGTFVFDQSIIRSSLGGGLHRGLQLHYSCRSTTMCRDHRSHWDARCSPPSWISVRAAAGFRRELQPSGIPRSGRCRSCRSVITRTATSRSSTLSTLRECGAPWKTQRWARKSWSAQYARDGRLLRR
jgi:hypothetical protein